MLTLFWDASHLWGYLLLHALEGLGVKYQVLKGSDIAQAGLSGKLLLVPGGAARQKEQALGPAGCEAVRRFVREGGFYAGFCGGAGLALANGLALCPWKREEWKREGLDSRFQHLISGHIQVEFAPHALLPAPSPAHTQNENSPPLLPVWWPARFHEPKNPEPSLSTKGPVSVLARYKAAGPDLHVSDLPLSALPPHVLAEWHSLYGVNLRPTLLDGQPCMITGTYGQGAYLLSYSHLETPASPLANACLIHLFHHLGIDCPQNTLPDWNVAAIPTRWNDPLLHSARQSLDALLSLACEHHLLQPRTPWLLGWKPGVPGSQCNNLRLALYTAQALCPTPARLAHWAALAPEFERTLTLFLQGAESWFLARRLADTLSDFGSDTLPKNLLNDQRQSLFGSSMSHQGLCGELCTALESLLFC